MTETEVAPGVYSIPLAREASPDLPQVYWVQGAGRGALINAGYGDSERSGELLDWWRRLIDRLGSAPEPPLLLLTDRYGEHVDGAAAFKSKTGAQVVIGRADAAALREGADAGSGVVDLTIEGGEEFDLGGGRRIVATPTPGHTPGSISYLIRGEGVLFTGDFILGAETSTTINSDEGGDMAQHIASLLRARELASSLVLSFHGPPVTDPLAKIDWLLERRHEREAQILTLLRGGVVEVDRVRDRMYEGLPEQLLGAARHQIVAHLIKLTNEGRVEAVDPGRVYRLT